MKRFKNDFIASWRKQLFELIRYPNYFLKSFFYSPVTYILPYYFLMKSFSETSDRTETFCVLSGLIAWQFFQYSVIETLNISNRELNIGILPAIFMTPVNRAAYFLGESCAVSSLFAVSSILMLFVVKVITKVQVPFSEKLLVICFCFIIYTWALSLVVYILNIMLKKIFNIVIFLLDVMFLICGVTYPLEQLPDIIQKVALLLPPTQMFRLLKMSLVGEQEIDWTELTFLIIGIMVTVLGTFVLLGLFEREIKNVGSSLEY